VRWHNLNEIEPSYRLCSGEVQKRVRALHYVDYEKNKADKKRRHEDVIRDEHCQAQQEDMPMYLA
jgi:hypothetical protein